MIYLKKTQPGPSILALERSKKSGTYNHLDVLTLLKSDFKNKCYICENSELHSINIEHFIPHKDKDLDLKFDWNNLFYSCAHCNNIKGAKGKYDNILNCTIEAEEVETKIEYEINPYPKDIPIFKPLHSDDKTLNTVELLIEVYDGTTPQKMIESANIRENLLNEILNFQRLLFKYYDKKRTPKKKKNTKNKIIWELSSESSFTAFKRWIIRKHKNLHEFLPYI